MRRLFGPFLILVALALASGLTSLSAAGPARAQEAPVTVLTEEDYAAWDKIVARAEQAIENDRASEAAFETLRADLVEWRVRFSVAAQANARRITTLEGQIKALGSPPEEGQTEGEEIAARRADLNAQYWAIVTPVRRAAEAEAQAHGLISEIDHLLNNRQRARLQQRFPAPLLFKRYLTAADDLSRVWRIIAGEVKGSVQKDAERVVLKRNLSAVVILLLAASVLLLRGRDWLHSLVDWLIRDSSGNERILVVAMIVSFGQVLLPMIGLIALVGAMIASSMLGTITEALLGPIMAMGIAFFTARWLGNQAFPKLEGMPNLLELSRKERQRGRTYFTSLGGVLAGFALIDGIDKLLQFHDASIAVLFLPLVATASFCLFGLGRLMIASQKEAGPDHDDTGQEEDEVDEVGFLRHLVQLGGRILLVFAVTAPVLALLGYSRAAEYLVVSPALSVMLFTLLAYLQRLVTGLMRLSFRRKGDGDGLPTVLVNFAIFLLCVPLFALIWGMRYAELQDLWEAVNAGVTVGETQISPTVFLTILVAFAMGFTATRLFQGAMRNSILPRTKIEPGAQRALLSGLGYVGITLSALLAISMAGVNLASFAIVAGALSVGVGFGMQNIVSNFVSGLILLIERPVTEGDWIEVGGVMGTVRKISVRATTVQTFDRTDVVVPNSDLVTSRVTNWTRGNLNGRLILPVGVAYGTDTRKVVQILQKIAEAHPLVIVNPPPLIVFQGFGADALEFEMRVVLRDINFGLVTRTELNHQIAEHFAREGIEVPFAQRDIWLRNPEALRPLPTTPTSGGTTPLVASEPDPDTIPPGEDET